MKPPRKIDGADILEWAWSGEKSFGVVKDCDGNVQAEIFGLAICKYMSSPTIYRFSCNKSWETVQDFDYISMEEAKLRIPLQYKNLPINWNKPLV